MVSEENAIEGTKLENLSKENFTRLKTKGFSDQRIANLLDESYEEVRSKRKSLNILPSLSRLIHALQSLKLQHVICTQLMVFVKVSQLRKKKYWSWMAQTE